MDQIKIGGFIAARRKAEGWTQSGLAEQLGVTDKAVSKWETGRSMPDLSLFEPLCGLLKISLNELMAGEFILQEELREKADQVLMQVITSWLGQDKWKPKEEAGEPYPALKLQDVYKVYQTQNVRTAAVNGVSFQVPHSSFTGIMGASGSGKTTLLNLIASIDRPTGGSIQIDGQNMAALTEKELAKFRREHLGVIFQEYNLLDSLTIYENIALAMTVKKTPKEKVKQTILELAGKLDISAALYKYPYEVSGGQRQRCACARAIAMQPSLILADEPTGALDSHAARQLLDTFVMLREDFGATILLVTHDALSASYCDRILFMQDGKIRTVLERKQESKQAFWADILETVARMAGDDSYVC